MKTNITTRLMKSQRGLSLIELLVALAIGSFLIIGAVTVQSQTRKSFDVNEQQSRLQESARFVLSVIEPEIQLAGLYGFTQEPNAVMWYPGAGGDLVPANKLHNPATVVAGLPASLKKCGDNFAIDVLTPVGAINGDFNLICTAQGGGAIAKSDTLFVRHGSTVAEAAASKTKLQLYSNRLSAATDTRLFVGDVAPDVILAGTREVRNLVALVYYVATNADGRTDTPAMRMKILSTVGGVPDFIDQELVRGVEDLQVQFGVDPGADTDGDTIPDDPGNDGMADFVNGYAARYVNPGDPILTSGQVVSVRVWVRVRADQPEQGFNDNRKYVYGSTDFTANDNYRRVLMSRTIFLRNSRQQ